MSETMASFKNDVMIDRVIEAAIPDIFTLADGTNSQTGIRSRVECILAHGVFVPVIEGAARGIDEYQRNLRAMAKEGL